MAPPPTDAGEVVDRIEHDIRGYVQGVLPGDSVFVTGNTSELEVILVRNWSVEFEQWLADVRSQPGSNPE